MSGYQQHGSRHAPLTGSDPIPGITQGSAWGVLNIGSAVTLAPGATDISWDRIQTNAPSLFDVNGGSGTTWYANVAGVYQVFLALTPATFWPATGDGWINFSANSLGDFGVEETGLFDTDGSALTELLTGYLISWGHSVPARVKITVANETAGSFDIVGDNVQVLMTWLGPDMAFL